MVRASLIIPPLIAIIGMAAFSCSMLPEALGAHPWWARQVALIGAPIGLIAAALAPLFILSPLRRLGAFAAALGLAAAAAHFGRLEFAASYAENALAGRAWYYGWIAVSAALSGGLTTLLAQALAPTDNNSWLGR